MKTQIKRQNNKRNTRNIRNIIHGKAAPAYAVKNIQEQKAYLPFSVNNFCRVERSEKNLPKDSMSPPEMLIWAGSGFGGANPGSPLEALLILFGKFVFLWSPFQWITSLAGLIIVYWIVGNYYNNFLRAYEGVWLDFWGRLALILFDLVVNIGVGMYYMAHRNTVMGAIMIKCPLAISPVIFLVELFCVWIYYFFYLSDRARIPPTKQYLPKWRTRFWDWFTKSKKSKNAKNDKKTKE